MRKILEIIVHCTATFADQRVTVADITRWHKPNGGVHCAGIGYYAPHHRCYIRLLMAA